MTTKTTSRTTRTTSTTRRVVLVILQVVSVVPEVVLVVLEGVLRILIKRVLRWMSFILPVTRKKQVQEVQERSRTIKSITGMIRSSSWTTF